MGKKPYVSFLVIIALIAAVNIFFRDPGNIDEEAVQVDEDTIFQMKELEKEVESLQAQLEIYKKEMADLRLKNGELTVINEGLKWDVEWLQTSLFVANRSLVEADLLDHYLSASSQLLYSETGDSHFLLFYKNEDSYILEIHRDGERYPNVFYFDEINPADGMSVSNDSIFNTVVKSLNGVITMEEVEKVILRNNDFTQGSNIIDIGNGIRLWYSVFDRMEKVDYLEVQAFNKDGEIVWQYGIYDEQVFNRGE
ncbi:MAG: bZIP transcription factor [Bacillus sp. (in: Bacteria)]|nr:bZIP transcription factor [Bacillus sp. (in: firmicutes)]